MQVSKINKLSNVQQELLKIYSTNISDNELIKLKRLLADFFAKELVTDATNFWKEKGLTDEDMDSWLNDEKQ
ncbi:MAG TPA: hypothetical protein PK771_00895 [Spirochaetota bacterium]|nr:hypothetical protein [Spirochaetota bacterium]